jgi:NADPH:quinone reductase-like Zn-dependent oxidoreductase/glyoxylase-like metal-dependent hydrolase (beta-lactamase superfamily II)
MRSILAAVLALSAQAMAFAAPESMQGVKVGEGGSLVVATFPVPKAGKDEVLIKVRAAGVNPVDWKSAARRVGQVPGADVSGVIESLGEGVTGWKVGEPVLGFARQSGSYAEYAVIALGTLARKPKSLTFEQAAGVPIAGETAYRSLYEAGKIQRGQTVLIHGAAGGVGSAAVQIAKAAGARVIGTASANNHEFLRSLGADEVIDYRTRKFEEHVKNVDLVLNTVDADTNQRSIGIVRAGGVLVSVVGPADAAACAAAKIRCVRPDRETGGSSAEFMTRVAELADAGKFTVAVEQVYSMADAAQAWEKSRGGHARGKLIIQVSGGPTMKPSLDAAAAVLRVDDIESLEFDAAGRYYQFGQAPAPELPWPAFEVDNYVASIDFERAAIHAKYHRVQVQEPGRLRPKSQQTMDQYAVNGITWNMTPAPSEIPTNLTERQAEIWASPQGFIRAARANTAILSSVSDGTSVVFTLPRGSRYEGLINAAGEVLRVRTFMDSNVLGDTPIEWRYSNYRDFGGVKFPARIERLVGGLPWYELDVSAVRVNQAATFEVPAAIGAGRAPLASPVEVHELATGLWMLGGGTHNSVVVEQKSGIVIIEAPLNEQRADAVLIKARELAPGKPIVAVINTHSHFDHAGGLRTVAAAGIPIVTQARNVKFYERAWAQPRTLNPDRLATKKRKAVFRGFNTRLVLPDARHPIEIHEIEGSGHNDAFAMIYLPTDRLLVEADAWTPTPPGAMPPAEVNPLWINLEQNIARLKLDVARVAPLHGTVQSIEALRAAIGKAVATD